MLRVPQGAGVRDRDRGDGAQPRDNLSGIVKPTHMGVASGEIAIRRWVGWILLDREQQFRHRFIEAPSKEMRGTYQKERRADAGAGTEPQLSFRMFDRNVGLARPQP